MINTTTAVQRLNRDRDPNVENKNILSTALNLVSLRAATAKLRECKTPARCDIHILNPIIRADNTSKRQGIAQPANLPHEEPNQGTTPPIIPHHSCWINAILAYCSHVIHSFINDYKPTKSESATARQDYTALYPRRQNSSWPPLWES
jgi:hypothetical protein